MKFICKICAVICSLFLLVAIFLFFPRHADAQTTTPAIYGTWMCVNPGGGAIYGYVYDICIELSYQCLTGEGRNCYVTEADCLANCVLPTPMPFIERPEFSYICTPGWTVGVFGINSAIGCIPISSMHDFTVFVLRWALGVGSGVAFLSIVYSGFLILTSQGNVEKVKEGKKVLTAAVSGIILIIFSVFILDLFGLQIFRIPGL